MLLSQVDYVISRIGSLNKEWFGLLDDVHLFNNDLNEPSLQYFLDRLYRLKVNDVKASHLGDKTPAYVGFIPLIHSLLPKTQFIHVIRDGRDVTPSALSKWGRGSWYLSSFYLLQNWVRYVNSSRNASLKLDADQYLEVYYEDLVREPSINVMKICSFIDEDFHRAMMDHTNLARKNIGEKGHVEVKKPINTSSVERWRSGMSLYDKKVAELVVGEKLARLGYDSADAGRFTEPERLALASSMAQYVVVDNARILLMNLGILTLSRSKRRR